MSAHQLEQMKHIEEMKNKALNAILTKEAWERLARVRTVNPQLAGQAELYLFQIYQTGKMTERITDRKMKDVLTVLTEEKKTNIRRV